MGDRARGRRVALVLWLAWFLALEVVAFLVPYTVLRNVGRLWGAFLFWNLFALLAIASIFILTARWQD